MAKIPLRAYVKEVENYIDRGEIEQAVAHAKNILKSYPKHIDTYRLLGKAYLESQRYSEAADILQRVLSVMPDDFISQIGMSIIREDEGNLDASIWHMERAYEVQPFNPAVQDELRRLYGRRDGVQPPKIRLTRGALVRMYARGELYPQAIAETRVTLAEDPQRMDLRVLLARLYYQAGQKNDAAEAASDLIKKLPYCYEANHLMGEILPAAGRAEEAKQFQQRVYALDPYSAFVSPSAPTSDQVPDQAVMVEQFMYDSEMEAAQAPEWTRSVGIEWEETQEEQLPDWLNTLKPQAASGVVETPAQAAEEETAASEESVNLEDVFRAEESAQDDGLIPDWMKDAGWTPSERSADEIAKEELARAQSEEGSAEEVAPAEIPDWLQSMAPAEMSQTPEEEQEKTDWLESILVTPTPDNGKDTGKSSVMVYPLDEQEEETPAPDWLSGLAAETTAPEEGQAETGDLPDWFAAAEDQQTLAAPNPQAEEDEFSGLPDWLQAGETTGGARVYSSDESTDWMQVLDHQAPEADLAGDATADWLKSLESEAEPQEPAAEETADSSAPPDWMKSLASETVEPEPELPALEPEPGESQPGEEIAAVEAVQEMPEAESQATAGEPEMPDLSDMDATMAWLEALAAKQGADEATLITPAEQRNETPPEWVKQEMEGQELSEAIEDAQETTQPESSAPETVSPEAEQSSVEELPSVETPDWLLESEPAEAAPSAEVPAAAEAAQPEAGMPDLSDMDAAMAWLESLAAKQGADEATLVTPPEMRSETPPEWVVDEMKAEPEAVQPTAEVQPVQDEPEVVQPDAEMGEFETPATLAEEEMPSEQPAAEIQQEEAQPEPSAEMDMDSAFAWLESLAAKQGAEEETLITAPEERVESAPEWVQQEASSFDAEQAMSGTPGEEETPVETGAEVSQFTAEVQGADEIPAWLESLQQDEVEKPAGEEVQWLPEGEQAAVTPEPLAAEPVPDWLAQVEDYQESAPETPTQGEDLSRWLMGLEEEGEAEPLTIESEAPSSTDFRSAWEPEVEIPQSSQEPVLEPQGSAEGLSLTDVQASLRRGDLETAINGYNLFIQNEQHLEETIRDLRDALYRYPVDIAIWQTLGDAYARNNQLQDALDSYTKAEELLR